MIYIIYHTYNIYDIFKGVCSLLIHESLNKTGNV